MKNFTLAFVAVTATVALGEQLAPNVHQLADGQLQYIPQSSTGSAPAAQTTQAQPVVPYAFVSSIVSVASVETPSPQISVQPQVPQLQAPDVVVTVTRANPAVSSAPAAIVVSSTPGSGPFASAVPTFAVGSGFPVGPEYHQPINYDAIVGGLIPEPGAHQPEGYIGGDLEQPKAGLYGPITPSYLSTRVPVTRTRVVATQHPSAVHTFGYYPYPSVTRVAMSQQPYATGAYQQPAYGNAYTGPLYEASAGRAIPAAMTAAAAAALAFFMI